MSSLVKRSDSPGFLPSPLLKPLQILYKGDGDSSPSRASGALEALGGHGEVFKGLRTLAWRAPLGETLGAVWEAQDLRWAVPESPWILVTFHITSSNENPVHFYLLEMLIEFLVEK